MNFSNFTKISSGNLIYFRNEAPIENVGSIKFYKDNASGTFLKREIRWSFDHVHWSSWEDLTVGTIAKINVANNKYLFFEIKYTMTNPAAGKVSFFSIEYLPSSGQVPVKNIEKIPIESKKCENLVIPEKKPIVQTPTPIPEPAPKKEANSAFIKIAEGNIIYFKNESPLVNVGVIKFYKDNATGDFLKKEFKWSFDRNNWSFWTDLNVGNISKLVVGDHKYLFLEIKYTMSSPTSGHVSSFSLEYLINQGKTYAPAVEDVNMDHGHILSDGCNDLGGVTKTFEIIKITDAETLCGKSCDYYLWRSNHKGFQPISSITELQSILNNLQEQIYILDPSTTLDSAYNIGGGAGVFSNKDVSARALVFKSLLPGNLITILNDPSTITINVSSSVNNKFAQIDASLNKLYQWNLIQDGSLVYLRNWNISQDTSISLLRGENRWTDPDPVSATIGGIHNGDNTLDGSTSIKILEKMLYEYLPPNLTLQTGPLTAGYYEKYNTIPNIDISGNFNNDDFVKVRITDASLYSSYLGGIGTIHYPDVSAGNFNFIDTVINPNWEDMIYTVKIYNKVGTTIMPPAEASTAIQFVNPYTWGIVDNSIDVSNISASIIEGFINAGNKLIVPKQKNEIVFSKDPSMGYKIKFVYAYDASYGNLKSIHDIKNNFTVTSSFDNTILNLTLGAAPTPIPYIVYIKHHWIDVSSFKLIFNI